MGDLTFDISLQAGGCVTVVGLPEIRDAMIEIRVGEDLAEVQRAVVVVDGAEFVTGFRSAEVLRTALVGKAELHAERARQAAEAEAAATADEVTRG